MDLARLQGGRKGRGAVNDPSNRFERLSLDVEGCQLTEEEASEGSNDSTEFFRDQSNTLICENHSPDLPFRYSINPYRGCEHGCAYCYARPSHETLGFDAGVDFESKIMVKPDAARLLRAELGRPGWSAEPITIAGVTDCYQPAERRLQITRQILVVLAEARQPFSIVTKNALVTRDMDLLRPAAEQNLVHVFLSLTTLDEELARRLEPRTSVPIARLRAVSELAAAGIPVGVMTAPVIPGLNDHEIPRLLQAAAEAGAKSAGYILLRLPLTVETVFTTWLRHHYPDRFQRVMLRIRDCRGGRMSDSRFGSRMSGEGNYATSIQESFNTFQRQFGLHQGLPPLNRDLFRVPTAPNGQQMLF